MTLEPFGKEQVRWTIEVAGGCKGGLRLLSVHFGVNNRMRPGSELTASYTWTTVKASASMRSWLFNHTLERTIYGRWVDSSLQKPNL